MLEVVFGKVHIWENVFRVTLEYLKKIN
jgi:hypothetical protein